MPKILVLLLADASAAPLADAAADGVRSVRFAEVDVRRADGDAPASATARHHALGAPEELATYDGIIVLASTQGAGAPPALEALLTRAVSAATPRALANKVGAAIVAEGSEWPVLERLAAQGLILVTAAPPPPDAAEPVLASARQLGHRVAHVAGWVTHARSHHH